MKILFCTDGSKTSYNALKNISCWVKDAIIDIICVIDWSFLPPDISIDTYNFSNSCSNVADTVLNFTENEIKKLSLTVGEKIKACGSAIESIIEQEQKGNYDLILMGSHGKKGIQKWLGSVSQGIINSSNTSSYISKEENKKQKLLFATDGTKCALDNVNRIIPFLNTNEKEIHICMVNEEPDFLFLDGTVDTNWLLDIQKEQQIFAARAIEDIKKTFEENSIKVYKTSILTGVPAQKIIDYTRQNDIDLIILGSRNKSRLDRYLTGSISKRILENVVSDIWLAKCSNPL